MQWNLTKRVFKPESLIISLFFLVNSLLSMESVILSENKKEYPLGLYLEILEDKEGKLTIEDVQKPEMEKNWIKSTSSGHNFGFTKTVYWTRFKVESQIQKDFFLEIAYTHLDKIDFFILSNAKEIIHRKAGDHLPFEAREIKYRNFVFVISPFDTPEGTYLLRFQTESSMQFPMTIWSPITFGEKKIGEMIGLGLYFGIMIVMILYNLFIWISIREKSYLYYVCYITLIALYLSNHYGITYQYFWFGSPVLYDTCFSSTLFLPFVFAIMFTSEFLHCKENMPLFYKLSQFLIVALVIGALNSFFVSYRFGIVSGFYSILISCAWMISAGVIMVKRRFRPATFYLLAWTIFLGGVIIFALKALGMIPGSKITEHAIQFGSAVEVVLLSLGLADRINLMKKEKEKAQAEALVNQKLAIENLEKANLLKDEFLANTSHELRTPLNGIIGIAESLSDGVAGNLTNKAKENLSLIISSGKRLSNLINDILDFSKLKHKDLQVNLQAIDFYSITNLVLKLSEPLIKNRELKLINELPKNMPAVFADENRLQQVLHNIIGNAIKFTEKGEIKISAELLTIPTEMMQITISDTGIGIPQEKLNSIFESFEQVDSSNTRKYGGTGLGLSVTKQLVELQGGQIYVESELGKGSKFIFTMQVTKELPQISSENTGTRISFLLEDNSEIPLAYFDPTLTDMITHKANHILVVDDEPINLQVVSNHFTFRGYTVTTASNGKEALAILEHNEKPDLVLLDVMMPAMNGFEVCHRIREKYDINQLPVIFVTAKNKSSDLLEGFTAEGNDYIVKPFSRDELLSRVAVHIKLKDYMENLEIKVADRTFQLSERMKEVEALKTQQDADYFLTTLLIDPLMANKSKSEKFKISFFIEQKKKFYYKEEKYQLGGDICISGDLNFNGVKYVFFFNGDAMGKSMQGAGGALVIGSVMNSILARCASKGKIITSMNPEQWLQEAYEEIQIVMEAFDGYMMVSCILGLIKESSGEMIFFNAEHPFSILVRDEKANRIEEKVSVSKIGSHRFIEFSLHRFQLQKNDQVFIGSDGKDDIKINGYMNEDDNFILRIIENSGQNMQSIYDSLLQKGEITDDISFVKIEFVE